MLTAGGLASTFFQVKKNFRNLVAGGFFQVQLLSAPPPGDRWLQRDASHLAEPAVPPMQKGQLLFPLQLQKASRGEGAQWSPASWWAVDGC